jgi:uncharacterized membrane protein
MENRPILRIKLTPADWALEIVGYTILVLLWALTLWSIQTMPSEVPIHFNLQGEVDRMGDPSNLLLLPVVASVIVIGLTLLHFFPHLFNYPQEVTLDNAESQYRFATRILRLVRAMSAGIFLGIVVLVRLTTSGKADGLGVWFLPVAVGLLLLLGAAVFVRSLRKTV